jgi:hypothetical protein
LQGAQVQPVSDSCLSEMPQKLPKPFQVKKSLFYLCGFSCIYSGLKMSMGGYGLGGGSSGSVWSLRLGGLEEGDLGRLGMVILVGRIWSTRWKFTLAEVALR